MATQAERTTATRQALIDASTQLLIEQGYAAFGEARVCELAGISRGSLRHQFPEGRYDLLPAMVASLLDRELAQLAALGPLSANVRMHLMLHMLVQRRQRHTSLAILEVWMASRGDERLAQAVGPLLATVPERLFGQDPNGPPQPELLALRLFLHGATLHSFAADYNRDELASAVQWLLAQLTPPPELKAVLAHIGNAGAVQRAG
ncbi:TetR family transcriptional regulator [Ralstonia sp. A12]|uniref:TetR/AcrR family transcriptional regulator n=1 Tax=Ralstonia sp. A12 TaxID=1217052 RepID=UPI00057583F2|nr:TetR/AcrR family transcriptional regulator [Ralstonia sp. A12]KHK49651.1 TetR family transcriptional regulator [Ralstonia sp. A12]